jgi:hypothetical protein
MPHLRPDVYGPPLTTHCLALEGSAAVRNSTRAAHGAAKLGRNYDRLSRLSYVVYFETGLAFQLDRRHGIASAHAICPAKPSVLAISR